MSVKAKCLNYTGCLLAYRGEVIELANKAPLVCPECGKTVTVIQDKGGGVGKAILTLLVVAAIGAGLYFLAPKLSGLISRKPAPIDDSGEVITPTPRPGTGDATPRVTSTTPEPQNIPAATPSSPAKLDLSLNKLENQKVRDEVLKRIDLMPNLTPANRDKLYNSVQRAKSMGLVVTIPFASGSARLPANELPGLKGQLDTPAIQDLRGQAICVFVILGYADSKGDEAKNLQISQSRAESVMDAMHKVGVGNVMHAVGMGGSKLFDPQNLEKNRVVEIWAVLP